jgi:hypothetical protein
VQIRIGWPWWLSSLRWSKLDSSLDAGGSGGTLDSPTPERKVVNNLDPRIKRLRELVEGSLPQDPWAADETVQQVLRAQWRLVEHVAAGGEENRSQQARNFEDTAKTEDRIRMDHSGRYPMELLQNAQDACADAGVHGQAWFRVTPSALLIANEGVPFTADRIRSLIRLGATTKRPGDASRHTIGYKGIGFTSVFELSRRPQIISQGVAFEFDRDLACREVGRILEVPEVRVPARYFPFPISSMAWREDANEVRALFSEGAVTVVRLPFAAGQDPEAVRDEITELLTPSTLLLMPALNALHLADGTSWNRRRGKKLAGGQLHHLRSANDGRMSWLVVESRFPLPSDIAEALDDETWAEVRQVHALTAVPWSNGQPDADLEPAPPLHTYFPTDDHPGRAVLVHGDFFLHSNRKRIQDSGPGGQVSDTVARGVVSLIQDLATRFFEERSKQMPALLRCLARTRAPDGYGEYVSRLLDGALAAFPILATVHGGRVSPEEAQLFGVTAPSDRLRQLGQMLPGIGELVDPDYESPIQKWLKELGAEVISEHQVQRNLTAGLSPGYDQAILAFETWWNAGPTWRSPRTLEAMRILQDSDGTWRCSRDLVRHRPGVPNLPPELEKATYQPPPGEAAAKFVDDHIAIEELSLEHCVNLLLQALESRRFGRNDQERESAHRFALETFRLDPQAIWAHDERGWIPVPVRSWRRGPASDWREAHSTYFSRDWSESDELEQLYRRFARREFLAVEPPRSKAERRILGGFYQTLGVADSPRTIRREGRWSQAPEDWLLVPEVDEAQGCPDGHPRTPRRYAWQFMDRLPELLDGINETEAHALARVLARRAAPFGADGEVWCTHSGHRRRRPKKVIGYQRWLLEERAWIPVDGDPLRRKLVRPGEAWVHVNGPALKACLARATIPGPAARKLALPSATDPSPDAAAQGFTTLKEAYPELSEAPDDVARGCALILQRFQNALRKRQVKGYQGTWPPFPAVKSECMVWHDRPAVPDIPFPRRIPLPVLPAGDWEELARLFSLRNASSLIRISTQPQGATPAELEALPYERRTQLAALLTSSGADLRVIARRLSRLDMQACDEIQLVYEALDVTVTESASVHLEAREDDSATLFIVVPLTSEARSDLARLLASHLGCPKEGAAILTFLVSGNEILHFRRLSNAALEEASEAMERYLATDAPEPQALPPDKQAGGQPKAGNGVEEGDAQDKAPKEGEPQLPKTPRAHSGASPTTRRKIRIVDEPRAAGENPETSALGTLTFSENPHDPVRRASTPGPSGARGGTGASGHPSITPESRRRIEVAGIGVAKQFAREHLGCVEVRDVQNENKGWDLEFILPSGELWPIEVKSFSASALSFILTRNELEAAKAQDEYRILLVTGVGQGTGEVIELKGPSSWVEQQDLDPMSWQVHGWEANVANNFEWRQRSRSGSSVPRGSREEK